MVERSRQEVWAAGSAYEPYVGRWSRLVAREFLTWLAVPPGGRWLDVGCGTGALSATVLGVAAPGEVDGVDRSEGFVAYARAQVTDPRARFVVADAEWLPARVPAYGAVVSALVLNFLPRPRRAVAEMARLARVGGVVASYVWDYAERMEMIRRFWDAAAAVDPDAGPLDEGRRFPLCHLERLADLWRAVGLTGVKARAIDVPTVFRDFEEYWTPFLGGQGPAPGYVATLDGRRRALLREHLRAALATGPDGSIALTARALAVRGVKPAEWDPAAAAEGPPIGVF